MNIFYFAVHFVIKIRSTSLFVRSFRLSFACLFALNTAFFFRGGILSVADYDSTQVGVVVVVVNTFFAMG